MSTLMFVYGTLRRSPSDEWQARFNTDADYMGRALWHGMTRTGAIRVELDTPGVETDPVEGELYRVEDPTEVNAFEEGAGWFTVWTTTSDDRAIEISGNGSDGDLVGSVGVLGYYPNRFRYERQGTGEVEHIRQQVEENTHVTLVDPLEQQQ